MNGNDEDLPLDPDLDAAETPAKNESAWLRGRERDRRLFFDNWPRGSAAAEAFRDVFAD